VDSTLGMGATDKEFLARRAGTPRILAWNKIDLPGLAVPDSFVALSATTGAGLEKLEQTVAEMVLGGPPAESAEPLIDSVRQRDLISRALAALGRLREARGRGVSPDLLAVDLTDAVDALGQVTGEVTTAEVLERMFSTFCVGK